MSHTALLHLYQPNLAIAQVFIIDVYVYVSTPQRLYLNVYTSTSRQRLRLRSYASTPTYVSFCVHLHAYVPMSLCLHPLILPFIGMGKTKSGVSGYSKVRYGRGYIGIPSRDVQRVNKTMQRVAQTAKVRAQYISSELVLQSSTSTLYLK